MCKNYAFWCFFLGEKGRNFTHLEDPDILNISGGVFFCAADLKTDLKKIADTNTNLHNILG